MISIPDGNLIAGELLGVREDGNFTNNNGQTVYRYKLGLAHRFKDGYGQDKSITHELEIFNDEVGRVQQFCEQNVGKRVLINPFMRRVKSRKDGKQYEFPSIARDTQLIIIESK